MARCSRGGRCRFPTFRQRRASCTARTSEGGRRALRRALVREIAPEIPSFAIPAIPGPLAASLLRNSSRNSKLLFLGLRDPPNGHSELFPGSQELFQPSTCLNFKVHSALWRAGCLPQTRARRPCLRYRRFILPARAHHVACRSPACSLAQGHDFLKMIGLARALVCEAS